MIDIGIMGDFNPDKLTHQMVNQALDHAANKLGITVAMTWIPTFDLESSKSRDKVGKYKGLIMAPGGPYHSETGTYKGIRFARENDKPFLGI